MDARHIERQALMDVWRKAKAVLEFSFDDFDEDAKECMEEMSAAVQRVENIRELIALAEQDFKADGKNKP